MATPETVNEYIAQFMLDTERAHRIVHGLETDSVETEGGWVDSFAKVIAEIRARADLIFAEIGPWPSFLGNKTRAQIASINALVAGGQIDLAVGSQLVCTDGPYAGRSFILQGMGTLGVFVPLVPYIVGGPLMLNGSPVLTVEEGQPYTFEVEATDGLAPYTYQVVNGPMSIDAETGVVTWADPVLGVYVNCVIAVRDALNAYKALPPFTLVVTPAVTGAPIDGMFLGSDSIALGSDQIVLST